MEYPLTTAMSLLIAIVILLLGQWLNARLPLMQKYNIPEPVTGGLLGALLFFICYQLYGYHLVLHKGLQDTFMLMFFASIGLSANFRRLKEGGKLLLLFFMCISAFVILQNAVGMSFAKLLGLDPLLGLMAGSIALVGGLGTAGAWGPVFEQRYGVSGALAIGLTSATFGMVIASLMAGPLARGLIRRHQLAQPLRHCHAVPDHPLPSTQVSTAAEHKFSKLTVEHLLLTLSLFATALVFAEMMQNLTVATAWSMPVFIWAILAGVILRNGLEFFDHFTVFDDTVDLIGNTVLGLYLAMALVSLKLWQLADLALPMLVLLSVQTLVMWLFAKYICFRLMGRDYQAAVLSAGLCGFGMGAMPNAMASIQAVTKMYGPSPKAFLIVPLVGAFLIDLVNVVVIQVFLEIFA